MYIKQEIEIPNNINKSSCILLLESTNNLAKIEIRNNIREKQNIFLLYPIGLFSVDLISLLITLTLSKAKAEIDIRK